MQNLLCQFLLLCHKVLALLQAGLKLWSIELCTSCIEKHSNSSLQLQPQMHAQYVIRLEHAPEKRP